MKNFASTIGLLGAALLSLTVSVSYAEESVSVKASEGQYAGRAGVLTESLRQIPDDVVRIVRYPMDNPEASKMAALGVGALILLDKPITKFYQNHIETPLSGFRVPASPLEKRGNGAITGGTDGWLLLGVGGTYLGGLVADDEKMQQAGLQSAKAIAYSYVASQVLLKSITGRKRPISWAGNGRPDGVFTDDPYRFGNFHAPSFNRGSADGTAMPSFHFTMFFAVAKVYQRTYDNYWIPYSLATVGLASNIQGHKHWVSDMVAGALVGTLIGSAVTEDTYSKNKAVSVVPYMDGRGGAGIQLTANY